MTPVDTSTSPLPVRGQWWKTGLRGGLQCLVDELVGVVPYSRAIGVGVVLGLGDGLAVLVDEMPARPGDIGHILPA